MKIRLSILALVVGIMALAAEPARAQSWRTATTALSAVTTTGASTAINTSGASSVMVHVYSASTSTSTVTVEQSLDNSHWFIVYSISNVASTGVIVAGPSAPYTRVNVTARSGGTISAKVVTRALSTDPIAPAWASIAG